MIVHHLSLIVIFAVVEREPAMVLLGMTIDPVFKSNPAKSSVKTRDTILYSYSEDYK